MPNLRDLGLLGRGSLAWAVGQVTPTARRAAGFPHGAGVRHLRAGADDRHPRLWVPEIVSSAPELGLSAPGLVPGERQRGGLRLRHDQLS
jgi:hypothetical protein